MRQIIGYLLVSLATFVIGVTTATPWTAFRTTSDSQAEREVLKVERQYLDAHMQRDTATLRRILADNFYFAHYWGGAAGKAERLALVENPNMTFASIDTRNVSVAVTGDRAYVIGQAVVRGSYRERLFTTPLYRYIRTYEKRDGRWQIVSVECNKAAYWR